MITLSLDENGDFEGYWKKRDALLIGGVLFDDVDDTSEVTNEKRRIAAFYRRIMEEVAAEKKIVCIYPKDLHGGGARGITGRNKEKLIKEKVTLTLPEFLQKGTYKSEKLTDDEGEIEDRKGKYYLYAQLKSSTGKEGREGERLGKLAGDDYASNLYYHMASDVVSRCVFSNPYVKDKESFSLELATRISRPLAWDGEEARKYREAGYREEKDAKWCKLENQEQGVYFELTNRDFYRGVVSKLILEDNPREHKVDIFNVVPISYYDPNKRHEFLYLADSICSLLYFQLMKEKETDLELEEAWFLKAKDVLEELLPAKQILLFSYDKVDTAFSKALSAYWDGDYYRALCCMYDADSNDTLLTYYRNVWFRYVEERIVNARNEQNFKKAVWCLYNSQLTNKYQQEKGIYIRNVLEKAAEEIKPRLRTPESKSILFMLYEAGLIAANHIGDSVSATAYYEKAIAHADGVSTEEYLRLRNTLVVAYTDALRTKDACKIAITNVRYNRKLTMIKNSIADQTSRRGTISLAKAISQLGQVLAFMKDKRTEKTFRDALSYFKDKSADYFITQSYLMHYYIEVRDKEAYDKEAYCYFGEKDDLLEQLNYLMDEGMRADSLINMKFALFLYLKGLYMFHVDEITDEIWTIVNDVEGYVNRTYEPNEKWKLEGHPSILICKYLCMIAASIGKRETVAATYEAKLKDFSEGVGAPEVEYVPIMKAIACSALCTYYAKISNDASKESEDKLVEALRQIDGLKNKSESDIRRNIDKCICYMYA